ncbi:unnamed protein product, partial [Protopolystoma xenopodis]
MPTTMLAKHLGMYHVHDEENIGGLVQAGTHGVFTPLPVLGPQHVSGNTSAGHYHPASAVGVSYTGGLAYPRGFSQPLPKQQNDSGCTNADTNYPQQAHISRPLHPNLVRTGGLVSNPSGVSGTSLKHQQNQRPESQIRYPPAPGQYPGYQHQQRPCSAI